MCSSVQFCSVHLDTEVHSIPSYGKKGEQKERGGKMKRREEREVIKWEGRKVGRV